jgi:hypothetical protein
MLSDLRIGALRSARWLCDPPPRCRPAQIGAAVAKHCGIPWNASAIAVQNNSAVSLTASAAQVRRPIYGSSSGRWRHYRHHLAPLIAALRERGISLPDDV